MADHIDGGVLEGHNRVFDLALFGSLLFGDDAIEQYMLPILPSGLQSDFLAVTDPQMLAEDGAGAMITWTYPEGKPYGVPTLVHPGMIPEYVALHEAAHVIQDWHMPGLESHDQRWLDIFMDLLDANLPEAAEVMRESL